MLSPLSGIDQSSLPPASLSASAAALLALQDAKDDFARLARIADKNPHAIAILRAADDQDAKLDAKVCWNSITLFFAKIVSWIRDGASNMQIKQDFIQYIKARIGADHTDGAEKTRTALADLINPDSWWPLDLYDVKQLVDQTSCYLPQAIDSSSDSDSDGSSDEDLPSPTSALSAATSTSGSNATSPDLTPESGPSEADSFVSVHHLDTPEHAADPAIRTRAVSASLPQSGPSHYAIIPNGAVPLHGVDVASLRAHKLSRRPPINMRNPD